MKRFILLILFFLSLTANAQTLKSTAHVINFDITEDVRIKRLTALAKVWGSVKYAHPYLAYKNIDWDKALIQTIPKVNASKSAQDYKAAIDHLLSFLNDKNTYTGFASEKKIVQQTCLPATDFTTLQKDVLIIKGYDLIKLLQQEGLTNYQIHYDKLINILPYVKKIIFDTRGEEELANFFWFFKQVIPQMLDTTIILASSRYRYHEGYTPQNETGSAGYYSALVNSVPRMMTGLKKVKQPSIAFLIKDNIAHEWATFLTGLQNTGRAVIIQEGNDREPGIDNYTLHLTDNVDVIMRTMEYVNPDGSIGFKPDILLKKNSNKDAALNDAIKALSGKIPLPKKQSTTNASLFSNINTRELTYPEMEFPDTQYRLLALFRFWNVMNYFFPYKNLLDRPWDEILPDYIRRFEKNTNAADYQLTLLELAAEIHDSHVSVYPTAKLDSVRGKNYPPLQLSYLEQKTFVEKVFDSTLSIKPGEVLTAIDDHPVESWYEALYRTMSVATRETFSRWAPSYLLRGQKNSTVKLTLSDAQGQTRNIELVRSGGRKFLLPKPALDTIAVLQNGYGYVDLTRVSNTYLDKYFDKVMNTPALILDMRGYPRNFSNIVSKLTNKRGFIYALHYRPVLNAKDLKDNWKANNAYFFEQPFSRDESNNIKGDLFKGKVVVLINNLAVSAAEHYCLELEAATDVTFIGTSTMGSDGAITATVLPGNIEIAFTGEDIRHADGRQLQRMGIQPDVRVEQTIKGVLEGRDEVLEAAINFLDMRLKK